MGPRRKSMVGMKFNRLTVVGFSHIQNGNAHWLCRCKCGGEKVVSRSSLIRETTKSCGCLRKEIGKKTFKSKAIHGMAKKPIYKVWDAMRQRCINPNHPAYKYYGGRGIKVYKHWLNDPMSFITWALANGYKKGLEIDRRNNDGNYHPNNCRFVNHKVNMNNTRRQKK